MRVRKAKENYAPDGIPGAAQSPRIYRLPDDVCVDSDAGNGRDM